MQRSEVSGAVRPIYVSLGVKRLRTSFGTATVPDIRQIHDTLNEIRHQNSDTFHSLLNQVIYVKKLSTATEINVDAIVNLSYIVKDNIVQSHDKFQQLTRDLMWLNITD
jgi:hypothetical protein